MKTFAPCTAILTLAACLGGAWAQSTVETCRPEAVAPRDGPVWSLQFLAGYSPMSSLGPGSGYLDEGAVADYFPLAFRVGCKCPQVSYEGTCVEGHYEGLLEWSYSHISRSFGNYFTGPCAILRYNYEREDSDIVPYIQSGAGLVLNDAYHEGRQRLFGQAVEFLLRAEVGVRFLLTPDWSLDVEGGVRHISNAGLAARNGGINNFGGAVGFTYTFGK